MAPKVWRFVQNGGDGSAKNEVLFLANRDGTYLSLASDSSVILIILLVSYDMQIYAI